MAKEATIKIRRSATAGKTPTINDLALGELAINTYDGKIFLKKSVNSAESIVTFSSITSYTDLTNIPQDIATTASPTFAGATLNGSTIINQPAVGSQNALQVAGYVGSAGSVFAVGVSSTPADGVNLQSLTSDLANPAKLTLSGSSIVLSSDGKNWTFTSGGNIKLPVNGDIVDSNNVSVLNFPTVKRVTYDNPIVDSNGLFYTTATATDSATSYITVDDSSGFTVGDPVTFYSQVAFGGILAYAVYYVRTIVDGNTITITDTKAGTTDFAVTDDSGSMVICTMSPFSYQTQRAPRQWTNYDSIATTGYDYSAVTFGDTYYDDTQQRIYIFVNLGDGTPQPVDFTAI
jgi:hypothetical protein